MVVLTRFLLVGLAALVTLTVAAAQLNSSIDLIFKHGFEAATAPDAQAEAPPLDTGVSSNLFESTAFLYSGPNPIQLGVQPGSIEPDKASLIRGHVTDPAGAPLPGVLIAVKEHPEWGYTHTQEDGDFDIVVNGGGKRVLHLSRDGNLSASRKLAVPWQTYLSVPDVMLAVLDSQVTRVQLSSSEVSVARGSQVNDDDGTRQATILFMPGTQASLTLPDGQPQSIDELNVRATEYTVGQQGSMTMPAELPADSAYTYAVEFSVDGTPDEGGVNIEFNQSLYTYVEDFIGFPVGSAVPVGFYDETLEDWVAAPNGRVIKILDIKNDLASFDTDGDGLADNTTTLAELDITEEERAAVAVLYTPGAKLWRVPITHFSTYDYNWPPNVSEELFPPLVPIPRGPVPEDEYFIDCLSTIETQNQTLGQQVPVAGTPYTLNYSSDRVPGRTLARRLEIPITGSEPLPTALTSIRMQVSIAGREFEQSYPPDVDQTAEFVWDGLDAYDRLMQSPQRVAVRLDYGYPPEYAVIDPENENAFGQIPPSDTSVPGRGETSFLTGQIWNSFLGNWDARGLALGGWTLDVHHVYDPVEGVLYRGDGTRRRAPDFRIIESVSATPGVLEPQDVVAAPDGSLYVTGELQVFRIAPDGEVTVVAGSGEQCLNSTAACGDGGTALEATFGQLTGIALDRDGSLLLADNGLYRLRKVSPDGNIETLAGNGLACQIAIAPCGDGLPSLQASFGSLLGIATGPDGSIYVADGLSNRIREISAAGLASTLAGSGAVCADPVSSCGDGGPPIEAELNSPADIAVTSNGSVIFSDSGNFKIRRVTQGVITTVAGNGQECDIEASDCGVGGPATAAPLVAPLGIALGADDTLYFSVPDASAAAEITPDGILRVLAGTGDYDYSGDGGPASAAGLSEPQGMAVGPDRSIFIADTWNHTIRRVAPTMPGFSPGAITILSEDGSQVYEFEANGRHVATRHALTGQTQLSFEYDSTGSLISIKDVSGNSTVIERGAAGEPLAIVGPYQLRTVLELGSEGYLDSIRDPADAAMRFEYTQDGLMIRKTDARGNASVYGYDTGGRLISDGDSTGPLLTLVANETPAGRLVTKTSALGRVTTHEIKDLADGGRELVDTFSDASQFEVQINADGSRMYTAADGTLTLLKHEPDPRFGMQAPVEAIRMVQLPSGLTKVSTRAREAEMADPDDPFSLLSWIELYGINGQTFSKQYDSLNSLMITTSAEGRRVESQFNQLGQMTRKQLGDFEPLLYTYDSDGRLSSLVQGKDPLKRSLSISYDANGYTQSTTDDLSKTVAYMHDKAGRITRQTLPDGRVIQYDHDSDGNLNSIRPPGRPAHTYLHNRYGQIIEYRAPDLGLGDERTSYSYDRDRLLTRVERPDGNTVDYGYDAAGRILSRTTPEGTVSYEYDSTSGLPVAVTATDGGQLTFGYDGSVATRMAWSGTVTGAVTRVFDENFRVRQKSVNGASPVTYSYDNDGLLTRAGDMTLTRSNVNGLVQSSVHGAISENWGYNGFGEVIEHRVFYDQQELYSLLLDRDVSGRIVTRTESIEGLVPKITEYSYDTAGRLSEVTTDSVQSAHYEYDSNSNRLSVSRPLGDQNGTYDQQDRVTEFGGASYLYNANGELISRSEGADVVTYEQGTRNLLGATLANGTRVDYIIDALDRRIGKLVNGNLRQAFLYQDGLNPIAELDGSNQVVSRFVYAHRPTVPAFMIRDGSTYKIITDESGSPRLVVDVTDGAVMQRIDYDEFGRVSMDSNPGFQPFGFAGGLYDQDTGLVQFGARDYDPELGRWMRKDPNLFAGASTNLYLYALAEPVNLTDPDGREVQGDYLGPSWNGPPVDFQDAIGTSERINETECILFACWNTGNYQETGLNEDGLSYYRACENGTCEEVIWDYQTDTSASAAVDILCEGSKRCEEKKRNADKMLDDVGPPDPGPQTPGQPGQPPKTPNQPPGKAGGDDVDVPYEGHTNWKICK